MIYPEILKAVREAGMRPYGCSCGWSGTTVENLAGHLGVAHDIFVTLPKAERPFDAPKDNGCTCHGLSFYSPGLPPIMPSGKEGRGAVNLTPEMLADLRRRVALWRSQAVTVGHVTPDDVIALLDRIEALEKDIAEHQRWDRSRVDGGWIPPEAADDV